MKEKYTLSEMAKIISKSSNDPAGLFLNKSTTLIPQKSPINHIPAVDTHRSNADVYFVVVRSFDKLHTANNCNNCKHLITGKCEEHGYQMPYPEIDCEQWEYRGKKA